MTQSATAMVSKGNKAAGTKRRIAIFTSCDSFEGFYTGTFGIDRETYLTTYRNDFVWDYGLGLRNCGHEVFIYILSYGAPELRKVEEGVSVRFLPLPLWLRGADALLWRLRRIQHAPALRDRVAYLGYGSSLQAAVREDRIDVLYHQEIWTPRFDVIVSKTQLPVVGADQGAQYADWMERAKRRSIGRAAGLTCQSLIGVERARKLGGQAQLMYNGVDTSLYVPPDTLQPRPKTMLAVGRLVEEQKRFSDLLKAMQTLTGFTLTLVGSGPDEKKLQRLAVDLGVADRVTFTGFIADRDKLRQLYRSCGVFVCSSSWEAVALVLLEAMSCGAPVVATRIPSFVSLITDGEDGFLVEVGAPDELAQAVEKAYEQQGKLGTAARETVMSRYSDQVLYSRLSSLIEAI